MYALKSHNIKMLNNQFIQELTIYEFCNALWKEVYLLKILDKRKATILVNVFSEILDLMNILSIRNYEEEILKTALTTGLTFYDASYIVLARNNNLILVTEDKTLREKATKYVGTKSLSEL